MLRAVRQGGFLPPRTIDPSIDRALEAVCLKAMALRPEDRYGACRALAEDIERWMADEPVSAWREPVSRRVRRWTQRNRTPVAAVVVALLAGVVGLGAVIGVQARANGLLRNAKEATDAALAESKKNALRADDNAGLINGALGQLVQRVGVDPRLRAAGLTTFRNELLRDVVGMYDELVGRNPGKGTLGLGRALNNQALVQYLLGEFPQAIASQLRGEAVLAALPPTYESRLALADARKQLGVLYYFTDKPAEGLTKATDAVSLYQALIREQPGDQYARFQLALATVNLGNYAIGTRSRDGDRPLRRGPRPDRGAPQRVARESTLYRVGSTDHEQPGTDPGRDRKDRGRRRNPARGGRPGRASRRRILTARCPGDLPQQPGRSPAESPASRRGRDDLPPGTQGLPDLGGPFPQRRGLPLGRGHGPDQSRGRRAPARPPQRRTRAHRGVEHDLRRPQEVTGHQRRVPETL